MTARIRLAAVASAGLVPWVIVVYGPGPEVDLVHSFGLVNLSPIHVTSLPSYLLVHTSGLPESLLAWPVASLLYAIALASAVTARVVGREDRRVTGGLLVLVGASLLPVTLAIGRPSGITALPVGTFALWLVAWVGYRDGLVETITGDPARER